MKNLHLAGSGIIALLIALAGIVALASCTLKNNPYRNVILISIDTLRARDVTRRMLAGISEHQARVVILDITGVPIVDSGVAAHLNKTIQAARLKGAWTIVTGMSDAVAETIVDLGIDWTEIATLGDLQAGLQAALVRLGYRIVRGKVQAK